MRTVITRLVGVLALAIGLSITLLAGSASAQIALGGPYQPTDTGRTAHLQAATSGSQMQQAPGIPTPGTSDPAGAQPGSVQPGGVTTMAYPCGWSAPNRNSYYNHCGYGRIQVNVEFWWGVGATRTICVGHGVTTLSTHPQLQGGLITYAYYNGRGC